MKKKLLSFLVLLSMLLFSVNNALAIGEDSLWSGSGGKTGTKIGGLEAGKDPVTVIGEVIKLLLGFLGMFAVVLILYAGFKWMTAGGSDDNIKTAKKMLSAGVIGLIIILSAYGIASFVIDQAVTVTQ